MQINFKDLSIRCLALAFPDYYEDVSSYVKWFGEFDVVRIMKNTGIEKIRKAKQGQSASDLGYHAARYLLEQESIDPTTVDGLVFVSQTPDYLIPSTSAILQSRLGLGSGTVCFDINWGCSGYIYGLYQAAMMVSSGGCQRVLLIVGDTITPLINDQDRSTKMIFGDAVSATIVERGSQTLDFTLGVDGSGYHHIRVPLGGARGRGGEIPCLEESNYRGPHDFQMNGSDVMIFTLTRVPEVIQEALRFSNIQDADLSLYVLHQANAMINEKIAKKINVHPDRAPFLIRDCGNTGPASIPTVLALYRQARPDVRLHKVLMCGFGTGLSWGTALGDLSHLHLYPPLYI